MDIDTTGSGLTSRLVMMALDGAMARHSAIALNLANATAEGYQPMATRFDEVLEQLRGRVTRGEETAVRRTAEQLHKQVVEAPLMASTTQAAVQLDEEMGKLARNSLQYQAVLTAHNKSMSILRQAIKEGRS
jgi:flagellar basal-body rod protein FlgB